ncbi:MAG: DUF433 domain-containing protein [Parvularcula sp.]|jgi:uncharacterized protein (DUF433 family)|nr:DUF433 domain-containing protein [Parvularcula sp.]
MAHKKVITAFTEDQVSRLTGTSVWQLRYWDRTDFFCPEYGYEERGAPLSRIYSYLDLVSLKVISRLREKVPLQRLRLVKEKLSQFTPDLWRGLTLWVDGRDVAFVHPHTGQPEQILTGQKIIEFPLRETVDDVDSGVQDLFRRDKSTVGRVKQQRRVMHNRPVIAGTRIPVSAIRAFYHAGYTADQILEEYPSLTSQDVEAALADDHAA